MLEKRIQRSSSKSTLQVFDGYKPTIKNEMEADMENGLYTAHEVAVILADAFGDDCACNFNGNDEWLPYLCELQEACPHPCGVACWEQYLKYKDRKEETLKNMASHWEQNIRRHNNGC